MTIKVFRLDDYEWWAGESLAACIAEARAQAGEDCYDGAEEDGYELTAEQMREYKFHDEDGTACSFACRLQELIDECTEFPVLFAATEW